jgi:hypothetical protein
MVDESSLPNNMLAFTTIAMSLPSNLRSYAALLSPSTFQQGEESLSDERAAQQDED